MVTWPINTHQDILIDNLPDFVLRPILRIFLAQCCQFPLLFSRERMG